MPDEIKGGSPYTSSVFDRWDRIVKAGADRPLHERRHDWEALYRETFSNGQWSVGVYDAYLVATQGWSLSMEAGDFLVARNVTAQWLQHPEVEFGLLLETEIATLWSMCAVGEILVGNVAEGIRMIRRGLADQPFKTRYEIPAREYLRQLLHALGLETPVDLPIRGLALEIIGLFPASGSAVEQASVAQTYRELDAALLSTYASS